MIAAMQAASRDAVAAALNRLDEVVGKPSRPGTKAAATKAEQVGTLGDELFTAAGLLDREPGLRRALADPSADPQRRERLLRTLLADRLTGPTLDVLVTVVTSRWSAPAELRAGIELLGRTAMLVRAEQTGRLDAVEDELFRLARIVAGQPDLERLLSDPAGDPAGKAELVRRLVGDKVEPATVALATQLVGNLRGRGVVAGLEELAAMAAQRRQQSVARVRSAVPLTAQQRDRLAAVLERIYARSIALHVEVDPELRGGLVIQVGDEIIDGSVAGRLAELRRKLAG